VAFEEDRNGPFYTPRYGQNAQIVAVINTAHEFYSTVYSRLLGTGVGTRARDAIDLMLLALSKSELEAEDIPGLKHFYEAQRVDSWSPFLRNALKILEDGIADGQGNDEEFETEEDAA
jgi:hypothetical protein